MTISDKTREAAAKLIPLWALGKGQICNEKELANDIVDRQIQALLDSGEVVPREAVDELVAGLGAANKMFSAITQKKCNGVPNLAFFEWVKNYTHTGEKLTQQYLTNYQKLTEVKL